MTSQEQKIFSYETLVSATKNFNAIHKLGEGGFGPVYKVNSIQLTTHDSMLLCQIHQDYEILKPLFQISGLIKELFQYFIFQITS